MMSSHDSDSASDQSQPAHDLEAQLAEEPQASTSTKGGEGGQGKTKGWKVVKRASLSEKQKEDVMDFLREKPHIYSKSQTAYKDAAGRKREWKELADKMGVDVGIVMTWYRSMRTMLARVKKMKSKSGSGNTKLSHAFQWVWDNLAFMIPYIETLDTDSLGQKRRRAAGPQHEADFNPDEPGPSRKVPRVVTATATTSSVAAPGPSPFGSLPGSSSHASHAECCGHLKAELQRYLDHAENHQTHFWHYLMWKTSNLNAHQRDNMERDVLEVVMRYCMNAQPAMPQPLPTTSSVVGFGFPQAAMGLPLDMGNQVNPQSLAGPSTEPDNELPDATYDDQLKKNVKDEDK